jgi:hypothetical protein
MRREGALKIVLALFGLLFLAGIADSLLHADQSMYTDDIMLSLYVALGVFLLMAVQNPSAHRSLIGFAAWSSFAHGAVMTVTAFQKADERDNLWAVAALVAIGVTLIALSPAKQPVERASAVAA